MPNIVAIRGAITVEEDTPTCVLANTRLLLKTMASENSVDPGDIVSIFFTATPDIVSCFPASAARAMGWTDTPLMSAVEMNVAGALQRCVRILMTVHSERDKKDIVHVYLKEAASLRPDLVTS